MIESLIKEKDPNVEAISDLSFSVSSERFSHLLFNAATNQNIKMIGRIL
jgi:hypothetical protein